MVTAFVQKVMLVKDVNVVNVHLVNMALMMDVTNNANVIATTRFVVIHSMVHASVNRVSKIIAINNVHLHIMVMIVRMFVIAKMVFAIMLPGIVYVIPVGLVKNAKNLVSLVHMVLVVHRNASVLVMFVVIQKMVRYVIILTEKKKKIQKKFCFHFSVIVRLDFLA